MRSRTSSRRSLSGIPQADREHAVDRLHESELALLVEVDQHLGVGARAELVAIVQAEVAAELGVVVDLAVEGDPHRAVLVGHRLVPGGADVDDAEPTVPQDHAPIRALPEPAVVGTAVGDDFAHPHDRRPIARRDVAVGGTSEVILADDPAHLSFATNGAEVVECGGWRLETGAYGVFRSTGV